ncbi:MAG: Crp/Fnr family transcriptional regulator [Betaproteobacteria bacterium]
MPNTLIESLARVWLFDALAKDDLLRLSQLARIRVYGAREVIVNKGDPANEFFVLLRGRAKVTAQGAEGSDTAINVMGPGEGFGEIGVLDGQPRSATVTTLEECEMAVVDKRAFDGLLASSPPVAIRLLAVLAGRIRELTIRVEDRAFLEVPARLAKQLLWLAGNHGKQGEAGIRIELKLSQQELGDFIGATRESVNKSLRDWSRSGFIMHERDYIDILDADALRAIAQKR